MDSEEYTFIKQTSSSGITNIIINLKRKRIEEREIDQELGESDYLEIDNNQDCSTDLEEGEVRDASSEIFRKKFKQNCPTSKFNCAVCYRDFTQKGNLLRHYQTHTGDRPFACKLCGGRFSQKSNLQKHLATHNGDKRVECGVCHKAFVQKANLIRHLRVHTGEKPFACDLCGHRFTQKANLKKHMQLHTKTTETGCDTAKMRYETSAHTCDKFPNQPEKVEQNVNLCDECPATFKTKRALLKHKKYHK